MNLRCRVELNQAERSELTVLLSGGKHAGRKLKRAAPTIWINDLLKSLASPPRFRPGNCYQRPTGARGEKATDEAYKSAMKRTPVVKQKADPWGSVRTPSANGNK